MDPALVELGHIGSEGGSMTPEPDADIEDSGGRNQYLQSGLYSSFAISSLQQHPLELHQPVKVEPRLERHEEGSSVIRFRTNRGHSSQPCTPPPAETTYSSRPSPRQARSSPRSSSSSSPPHSPIHTAWRERAHTSEGGEADQSVQPLNLSSGQRERLRCQRMATPERRGLASGSPLKSRKPKGLEISASSLLLTGSDLVSIALNSPALPSGSLTPALFTTQVRRATQSPVLPLEYRWFYLWGRRRGEGNG